MHTGLRQSSALQFLVFSKDFQFPVPPCTEVLLLESRRQQVISEEPCWGKISILLKSDEWSVCVYYGVYLCVCVYKISMSK